ncbi:hypothetical protein PFLUOLIPICF7_02960 [Pseudomonas simiae]|nr:hypothetical protein PFLUOLIPICF7_02960 [Pseudomonas simiae]
MCGLCGLLGEDLHWSDPLGDELPRRRERLRRIAAINQVLAVFRLKVEDFQGASYLLLGATGKQALASDGLLKDAIAGKPGSYRGIIEVVNNEHGSECDHRLPWQRQDHLAQAPAARRKPGRHRAADQRIRRCRH